MHKLISTTFKILALSMLFMFLLDTTLIMVEIVSVHSKVSNIMGVMQNEVARNNCMPTALAGSFTNYFDDLEDTSKLMDNRGSTSSNKYKGLPGLYDIKTNLTSSVTVTSGSSNTTYPALTPTNAGEYGDFVTLAVEVTLHPSFVYYNTNKSNSNQSMLTRGAILDYKLNYVYSVPCLRYLK